MRKKLILVALSIVVIGAIILAPFGLYKHTQIDQAKAVNSEAVSSPCGCHESKDVNKQFIIPSKSESSTLIQLAKTQKIYKDYD